MISEPTPAEVTAKLVILGVFSLITAGVLIDLTLIALYGTKAAVTEWFRTAEGKVWLWDAAWGILVFVIWLLVHAYYLPSGRR